MNDVYGIYKIARNASWQALIDFKVKELPVSVIDIAKKANITVVKNSIVNELNHGESGISIFNKNNWFIVYDDNMSKERTRYTIAHELGHIYLGHPIENGYIARSADKNSEIEWQAERFAIGLLAPACVLWALNLHTADQIQAVCKISHSAAEIRAERMKVLYERKKFLTHPLEQKVFEQFSEFIQNTVKK